MPKYSPEQLRKWGIIEITVGACSLMAVLFLFMFLSGRSPAVNVVTVILGAGAIYLLFPLPGLIISGIALLSTKKVFFYLSWIVRGCIILFYLTGGFMPSHQNVLNKRKAGMSKEAQLFAAIYDEDIYARPSERKMPVSKTVGIINSLLAEGADINAMSSDQFDPKPILMYAIFWGREKEIIAFLLEKGADVNARTRKGETALTLALNKGDKPLVRLLLDAGADIHNKSIDLGNGTVLMAARSDLEMIKMLVDRGANINDKDRDGVTVLMTAASFGSVETVKYLVEQGAFITEKDNEGRTALDYAENSYHNSATKKVITDFLNSQIALEIQRLPKDALPDLVVKDILYQAPYLRIFYCNEGKSSLAGKDFLLNLSSGGRVLDPRDPFQVPEAGKCSQTDFNIRMLGLLAGGTSEITATIDSRDNVRESNETNNTLTKKIYH